MYRKLKIIYNEKLVTRKENVHCLNDVVRPENILEQRK